ncbi:hypothetical protein PRBEI_2001616100 [Prionailurus iriomotensis]
MKSREHHFMETKLGDWPAALDEEGVTKSGLKSALWRWHFQGLLVPFCLIEYQDEETDTERSTDLPKDFIRKAGGLPDKVKKPASVPHELLDLLYPQQTLTSLPLRSEATLNGGSK